MEGSYSIPVTPIAFSNGVVTVPSLAPRQAAYYSVVVPPNQPSWRVELDTNVGDVMMEIQLGSLPDSQSYNGSANSLTGGRIMNKAGSEQYLLMPNGGARPTSSAARYYIAVISQGVNQTSSTIGTGASSYTLGSYGSITVTNIGVVDATGATDLLVTNTHSVAGQFSTYRFNVPANTLALQVSLTNTTGSPNMYLRADSQLPGGADGYGNNGGQGPRSRVVKFYADQHREPGCNELHTLMVQGGIGGRRDASFTVRVHAIRPIAVNFDGGAAFDHEPGGQCLAIFQDHSAAKCVRQWDLRLTNVTSGNFPQISVCSSEPPPGNGYGWEPLRRQRPGYD